MKKEILYQESDIEIRRFDGENKKEKMALALSYMHSYNSLSRAYKTPQEMELYTYDVFLKKLDKIAKEESSDTFVIFVSNKPKGFARYSPIPEYYKGEGQNGIVSDREKGSMDGYDYDWVREIKFDNNTRMNDKTVCLNQIYLDPSIQSKGLGTTLLRKTLPVIEEKGFDNIIIEYNVNNERAKKFYAYALGLQKIANTQDFDNIVTDKKNKQPVNCISDVEIGHNTIGSAMVKLNKIENSKVKSDNTVFTEKTKGSRI